MTGIDLWIAGLPDEVRFLAIPLLVLGFMFIFINWGRVTGP